MTNINHLAIIMDGNGRWAEQQGLPRAAGHKKGAEVVRAVTRAAKSRGVKHLTLFAFSSLNWGRPTQEVNALMDLLCHFLESQETSMVEEGIALKGIGERSFLPKKVRSLLERVEQKTSKNQEFVLNLAMSYDGRRDLVKATQQLVSLACQGLLLPADVQEELIMKRLATGDTPDVDLLIRTSGEQRLSGFLPIEACYAELVFIDKLWPDFSSQDLDKALDEFEHRQRRFGLTGHQLELSMSPA